MQFDHLISLSIGYLVSFSCKLTVTELDTIELFKHFPARCIDKWNILYPSQRLDEFKNQLDIIWRETRFDTSSIY